MGCCFIIYYATSAALPTLLLSVSGTIQLMSADSYSTFHAPGRLTHAMPKRINLCHTHRHIYCPFILNLHCVKGLYSVLLLLSGDVSMDGTFLFDISATLSDTVQGAVFMYQ